MFYPSVYEVKLLKEQEIRERVARAEIDNYARSIRPHRLSLISRLLRSLLHSAKHLQVRLGSELDVPQAQIQATRRSNAVQ